MRVLLDECVNPRVRQAFIGHEVRTIAELNWRTLPDTKVIAQAQGQFDAFVTIDRGFEFEVNMKSLSFGIIIVHVKRNRIEYYRPIFPALLEAVARVKPGEVIHIAEGSARPL